MALLKLPIKTVIKIIGKAVGAVLGIVLALLLLVWGGLNVAKFFIYSDYYGMKTDICRNPGLSDGFVCQGICSDDDRGKILVSGYMKDGSASRIYVTDRDNDSYYIELEKDGKPFDGHAGGIAVHGDTVYVADDLKLYTVPASELFGAENGDAVEMGEGTEVNNSASFCFADEEYVYVGEFHDGGKYVTEHPYDTDDGTYYAIMSRYTHGDLTKPDKIYSIRNKVQGMCMTDDGKIVLSTSYGLSDTVYYVYDEAKAVDSGLTLDGAPVFYLTECEKEFKGPAMGEGLDYSDGKVITLTESASDKYIFGKFFFADKIVGLDIE